MRKKYSDKLPCRSRGHKCQALDDDGNLCDAKATITTHIHRDSEIISYDDKDISWAVIHVCNDHIPQVQRSSMKAKGLIK